VESLPYFFNQKIFGLVDKVIGKLHELCAHALSVPGQIRVLLKLLFLPISGDGVTFHFFLYILDHVVLKEVLLEAGDAIDVEMMSKDSRCGASFGIDYKQNDVRDSLHLSKNILCLIDKLLKN
jgi:hypothetical protein